MNIKLVLENAQLPKRTNPTDAGADLFSPIDIVIPANASAFVDFGVQMEIPDGFAGFIYARSGLGSSWGITPRNCVGVIDAKYRGNIGMMVRNDSNLDYKICIGDRIAQIVFTSVYAFDFNQVDELCMIDDRNGGFGHSGK